MLQNPDYCIMPNRLGIVERHFLLGTVPGHSAEATKILINNGRKIIPVACKTPMLGNSFQHNSSTDLSFGSAERLHAFLSLPRESLCNVLGI